MKNFKFLILFIFLFALSVSAQISTSGGARDYGARAADPATCNPRIFSVYRNTVSNVTRYCSDINTWSNLGGSGGGTGLLQLNGLTADPQNFATGTSGTNFNISSSGSTHTFNFPDASGSNRGLLTSADWTTFNGKGNAQTANPLSQFASTTSAQLAGVISNETGSGALVFGTSPTLSSPIFGTISNTGTLTLPTSTDTLVGRATTDTLTNKTITSPTFSGTLSGTYTIGGTPTFPSSVVQLTSTQTLTNKTISGASNTLSNIAQSSVTNLVSDLAAKASVTEAKTETMIIAVSDETTDLTTGTAKLTFRMPYGFTLSAVRASVGTASAGATVIVDINENGTTILSTKLSIDASEKTSTTAATAAVISDSALADDSEITIDIDQVGSSTAGKGLKVYLIGVRN